VASAPDGIPPITRHAERGRAERAVLDALLDDQMAGTLSLAVEGRPWVVPLLIARDGDRVLLHGSTGAGALRRAAGGAPVVVSVFALDGIVVAHSTFESSANYRSAVVQGVAEVLEGVARTVALERFSNRLLPGRTGEVQPMTAKEQAATLVLALPIGETNWLVKTRTGHADPPDAPTDAWCGVIPLRTVAGRPEAAPWTSPDTPVPASVQAVLDARREP
jgi:nitroimidazol reductase NimA-like FMN-containing flavoprotein (pyridoxamine 5'-phosphate oxidase superfamily)